MHTTPVLTDSRGNLWVQTPKGTVRIPQPFHYRFMNRLLAIAARVG